MRCLITGADGRLGRALTRAMTGRPDLTVWSLPKDRLDITSRSALERCMREFRPDWVVNAAAVTRAPEDRLYEYDRVNAEGAGFVAEATRAAGARILQVSTDYVFSGEGEAPWCERDRPSARGPYGRSKEEGEYAVMRSGAAGYIVRAGWLHSGERDFVDAILTRAARGEILRVVDKQVGKPSETEAFAAWLVRVLTECPAPSRLEIEHYVERGDYVSRLEEARFILSSAQRHDEAHAAVWSRALVGLAPARSPTPRNRLIAGSSVEKTIGISEIPTESWQKGVDNSVIKWLSLSANLWITSPETEKGAAARSRAVTPIGHQGISLRASIRSARRRGTCRRCRSGPASRGVFRRAKDRPSSRRCRLRGAERFQRRSSVRSPFQRRG